MNISRFFWGITNIYLFILRAGVTIYASSGLGPLGPKSCWGNKVIGWFLVKCDVFEKITCFFRNCTRYHAITCNIYIYLTKRRVIVIKFTYKKKGYFYRWVLKRKHIHLQWIYRTALYNSSHIYIYIYLHTLHNIKIDLKTNYILIATTARYLGKRRENSHRDFPMLVQSFNICLTLKPAAHEKKWLSKKAWQGRLLSCFLLYAA